MSRLRHWHHVPRAFLFRIPAAFTMAIIGFLGVTYVVSFNAALT